MKVAYPPHGRRRGRPAYAALGLRAPRAQHTRAEVALLERYARDARCVVELGVAEGASAWAMRGVIDPRGRIYLVDPYVPRNALGTSMARLVAHRLVRRVERGDAVWIRKPSDLAADGWDQSIDFLFIDGDHSLAAVTRDWELWSPHVRPGGAAALHGAAHFPLLGTTPHDAPIRFVEQLRRAKGMWSCADIVDSTVVFERAKARA
jgi:predicted O-methyltransferase YrrM